MKLLSPLLFIIILVSVIGCKKDCPETPQQQLPKSYLSTTEGSWWAYAIYYYGHDGTASLLNRDTLRVLGDTTINEYTYTQYKGSLQGFYSGGDPRFRLRDSAFYLINDYSRIILPYLNFTDTFFWDEPVFPLTHYRMLVSSPEPVQTPAGTFETIDYQFITLFPDTTPCGTTYGIFHQQFAEHVGVVRATTWYTASYGCGPYTERVLESYHIAD